MCRPPWRRSGLRPGKELDLHALASPTRIGRDNSSDEHDKSPGEPSEYLDMIAQAKRGCGGLDCVVGAGLLEQECFEHDNSPKMKSFLDALAPDPTIVGEIVCESGTDCMYPEVVGEALAGVILETCKSIDPPE